MECGLPPLGHPACVELPGTSCSEGETSCAYLREGLSTCGFARAGPLRSGTYDFGSTLASVTNLSKGHASSASRRVYSQIGIQPGRASTGRLKPSECLIVLAQRNAKTPLLSLWQRDGERRSCIGR
jgi:hypothetical protein